MDNANEHWNDYWAQGHLTSFGAAFTQGYEGIIKEEWDRFFKSMPNNVEVLDLCTGNASLIRLAKTSLNNSLGNKYTGVDYAQIKSKDGFSEFQDVNLLFGVNVELLPFEQQSFDCVISNFGFEYSDINKTIAEAARVLKVGGKLELVCHCYDSMLIKTNSDELNMLTLLLSDDHVIETLEKLIDQLVLKKVNSLQGTTEQRNNLKAINAEAEKYRFKLNDAIGQVAEEFPNPFKASDFLGFLRYLLKMDDNKKNESLALYKKDINNHKVRLASMINAALTNQQLAEMEELFSHSNLISFNVSNVISDGEKIACRITATKI